jgi:hypothetical protein
MVAAAFVRHPFEEACRSSLPAVACTAFPSRLSRAAERQTGQGSFAPPPPWGPAGSARLRIGAIGDGAGQAMAAVGIHSEAQQRQGGAGYLLGACGRLGEGGWSQESTPSVAHDPMNYRRRLALAVLFVAFLALASTASGQEQEPQSPTELWEEYPLTPTTGRQGQSPPARATEQMPTVTAPSNPAPTRPRPVAAQEGVPEDVATDIRSLLPIIAFALVIWPAIAVAFRLEAGRAGALQQRAGRVPMKLRLEEGTLAFLVERGDRHQRPSPAVPLLADGAGGQKQEPGDAGPAPPKMRAPKVPIPSGAPPTDKHLPGPGPPSDKKVASAGPPAGKNVVPEARPPGKEVSGEVHAFDERPSASVPAEKLVASGPPAGKSVVPERRRPRKERGGEPHSRAERASAPVIKLVPASPPTPVRAPRSKRGRRAEPTPAPARRSRPASGAAEPGARFETCVIEQWRGFVKSDFFAIAVRPRGSKYVVGRSDMFHRRGDETPPETGRAAEVHADLVERLVEGGWEPYGESVPWFRTSFRRRLRPTLHELVDDPEVDED